MGEIINRIVRGYRRLAGLPKTPVSEQRITNLQFWRDL